MTGTAYLMALYVSAPNVLMFKTKLDIFLYDRRFDFIIVFETLSFLYQLIILRIIRYAVKNYVMNNE